MKQMTFKRVLCAAVVALVPVTQAVSQTVTDTMTLAYRNSGLLEQNRALLRAADEDVAQAVSALRPIINWSAQAGRARSVAELPDPVVNNTSSASIGITLSLLLYDGGSSKLAVDAAKEQVLATRQGLLQVEQQILQRAVMAHLDVRRTAEVLELRQSNVRLINKELGAARDRFEVGEVTRTDVSQAEARLAAARAQVAAAEGQLAQAREEYRAAVGQYPKQLQKAQVANVVRKLDAAKNYAVQMHPSVIQQRHAVAAADLNVRRAETAMNPTIRLQGSMGHSFDNSRTANEVFNQSIGVNVNGPIYQGGALSSAVRQAKANRDAARARLHIVSDNVQQQVGNAYSQLRVTGLSLDASNRQVRAASTAFNGVREEATLGARTTLDVLNAEQTLLNARVDVVSSQIDRVAASYNALASMGLLNASYLKLPVQQYDPAQYYNLVERAPVSMSKQGKALDRVLQAIGD